jgi:SAM-dependent methyltransferase
MPPSKARAVVRGATYPAHVADHARLRQTFDEVAELYDRARPDYPAELFDRLAQAAALGPGSRVLEIGCGTGQATVPLAGRGYEIVAVELGPALAAVARRNLAGFASVEVVNADFEQWPLPERPFDVVFSATAFHWIDPAVRVPKSARALRPGGVLAIVATEHVAGGTERFFADAQRCYERFDPATPPGLVMQPASEFGRDDAELTASGLFGPATFHRWERDLTYTTREYLDVLLTYSGHRALPADARAGLLDCLARLIDNDHGGRITKRYLTELTLAQGSGGAVDSS